VYDDYLSDRLVERFRAAGRAELDAMSLEMAVSEESIRTATFAHRSQMMGTFETCRRTLKMSASRGRPE
jgi:hypothetical protein